jgi:hypothetical protein
MRNLEEVKEYMQENGLKFIVSTDSNNEFSLNDENEIVFNEFKSAATRVDVTMQRTDSNGVKKNVAYVEIVVINLNKDDVIKDVLDWASLPYQQERLKERGITENSNVQDLKKMYGANNGVIAVVLHEYGENDAEAIKIAGKKLIKKTTDIDVDVLLAKYIDPKAGEATRWYV